MAVSKAPPRHLRTSVKPLLNLNTWSRGMTFSDQEVTVLLDVLEKLEPIGAEEREEAAGVHIERYRGT